ncbi:bifunctional metallophosphatase/5'-nucleotidase [Halalkalirubrum salinum]|uniref:bifunctional metallophosphatase/5'-nucleotidase n=1 Tax=Halalkalirubrum salinum TaxID=2563889 RepID=UPI0010FBAE59|nr:5'-nucleotidase C-terminal domain-containing protein [Halalkalirubrum salinum]
MVRLLHYSDIENIYDEPDRVGRFAGLLSALDGEDALVVGTGDNTAPGVTSLVSNGRQALDLYSAIDPDLETFGNHDFDYGPDAAAEIVADSPQTWVSTNVRTRAGDRFAADAGVVPTATRTVDGVTIGFFGVTDPATPSLNPMATELAFDDPIEAANEAIETLQTDGVDRIVALSHLGSGDDELARKTDVDVILGGHIHRERIDRIDGTLLTRPGVNGETVLEVVLDGTEPTVQQHTLNGAATVDSIVASLRGRLEAAGVDTVVGTVDDAIDRDPETVHGGECRIGNFVADAYRWAADTDVGLQNSGGIRPGMPLYGEVTIADLISVIPFEEPVVSIELTGEELWSAFESLGAPAVDFGADDWWHGHVSNATVRWDEDANELTAATVGGEPIDPDRIYTVATAEYLLHSDHEFPVIDSTHYLDDHGVQHEVLASYARTHGINPAIEGRIVRE